MLRTHFFLRTVLNPPFSGLSKTPVPLAVKWGPHGTSKSTGFKNDLQNAYRYIHTKAPKQQQTPNVLVGVWTWKGWLSPQPLPASSHHTLKVPPSRCCSEEPLGPALQFLKELTEQRVQKGDFNSSPLQPSRQATATMNHATMFSLQATRSPQNDHLLSNGPQDSGRKS